MLSVMKGRIKNTLDDLDITLQLKLCKFRQPVKFSADFNVPDGVWIKNPDNIWVFEYNLNIAIFIWGV